jgi:outer membrane lipoprotein-sorting protein
MKNRITKNAIARLLCLLCIFCFAAAGLQAQTPVTLQQVFSKMDEIAKTFRSVETNMERTKVTVLVNDRDVASGKLYYVKNGNDPRLKVEISKPAPQSLLIDKGKLQFYQPNIKQVQEASTAGRGKAVEQFMALGFGQSSADLQANYDVKFAGEEVLDGQKTAMLDLVPKTKSSLIKTVRIWMDVQKGISLQVKATEPGGDYTIFKYSNIRVNSPMPGNAFDLRLPPDVKVSKIGALILPKTYDQI